VSNLKTGSVLSGLFGRLLILNEITGHITSGRPLIFAKNIVLTIFLSTFSLDMLFMAALRSNGQDIMFYSGDLFIHYLFFYYVIFSSCSNLSGRRMPSSGPLPGCRNVV